MLREQPCIICSRLSTVPQANSDSRNGDNDLSRTEEEDIKLSNTSKDDTLKRFFQLLSSYLIDDPAGNKADGETRISSELPFQGILSTGLLSCEECSKIMGSFCELYHQMKSIQLQVNCRLLALRNIMSSGAEDMPTKTKVFKEWAQLPETGIEDVDETIEFIFQFRRDLIKECSRKLGSVPPHDNDGPDPESDGLDDPSPLEEIASGEETAPRLDKIHSRFDESAAEFACEVTSKITTPSKRKSKRRSKQTKSAHSDSKDTASNNSSAIPSPTRTQEEEGQPERINLSTKKFICSRCPLEFDQKHSSEFGLHFRRDHLKVRLNCPQCKMQFPTRQNYQRHYRGIHMGVKFICHKCGQVLSHHSTFAQHLKNTKCGESQSPTPLTKYPCRVCKKEFTKPSNVRVHMKTVHLKLREHLCDFCGKGYKLKSDLKRHRLRDHHREMEQSETKS